jgi:hypothetical protein
MSIAEISRRVELHFWDWAIPALSASPKLQKSLRVFYRTIQKVTLWRRYLIGAGLAMLGFTNGLFIFWLVAGK